MDLDVSKLKKGDAVKNYRVMCELLGQEVRNGRSKKFQMDNWKRFFSWHTDGQKFTINEIYDVPAPKIDLRSDGNYNKYTNEIADILVHWLSDSNNTITNNYNFSLGKLIDITCMANPSFDVGNKFRQAASIVLKLDREEVEVFFTDMRSEFKEIIERALKILQKRCVVLVKNSITIYDKEQKCHRLAAENEEKLILDWEKQALEKLGLRDRQEMFLKRKLYEFNKIMNKHLSAVDWKYYYHSYNLTIGQTALAIEKKIIDEQEKKINRKCVERGLKKFNDSDIAKKLITSFIDMNTDFVKLRSEIKLQQESLEEEKKQKREKAIKDENFDKLMGIAIDEEKEIEKQYQYDVNGYAKKSLYNQLTPDEKIFKELGLF